MEETTLTHYGCHTLQSRYHILTTINKRRRKTQDQARIDTHIAMFKKATPVDPSSSDLNDETSSSDGQRRKPSRQTRKKDSLKSYVTDVLSKHSEDDDQRTDLRQSQMKIRTGSSTTGEYENISAFRPYQSNTDPTYTSDSQRRQKQSSSSDDELENQTSTEQIGEFNLDPNPIHEVRDSGEKVYTQKVYLRQLQPPTPQPVEIQVKEVLVKPQTQKAPIHVRVGQREPRTPSPIIIKTAPPQPPPAESNQPIVYNKYLPPPKQPPQQIIIHRYPDLPPKPRPIVVEQWLPYKPAPKRIIKHSLPPEALQPPPPPHNIIISYTKPRALIEVELVRLPVVKIDPQTYEQMSAAGQKQLIQNPTFEHEQDYLAGNRSARTANGPNQINWRI